jgi:subtilase family serine protease
MERILLQLASGPEQDAALDLLLAQQQDPSSVNYHVWLTPEQFGERFGALREEIATIASWLQSQGFHLTEVAPGRRTIEFSGIAAQVETAFHTRINQYGWHGERHVANAADIYIPAALAPAVAGVASLNNFGPRPLHHVVSRATSLMDLGGESHALTPYDFAAIYGVTPLWTAGYDGAGQSIAIVGESDIALSDVRGFRSVFGLPVNDPTFIVNGADPGYLPGDQTESTLDVEWAGAVAKGASIVFVTSAGTNATDGVTLSAQYIVQNKTAPVMSLSYGLCEEWMGSGKNTYSALWQQAAAEGIAVFVANGDSGSAGCDAPTSSDTMPASQGFAVNGLASTPFNVAVGGTEFNDATSPSTYWNPSNNVQLASAKGYIPEVVWNESSYTAGGSGNNLYAGGGGPSALWSRPSWQTGSGVPSGSMRLTPDVSLTAAGHDGYAIELNGSLYMMGGTSASAPSFAGLMAIVNQYTRGANGNPAARLYALAASVPSVYHDVTGGSNAVPCESGSAGCSAHLAGNNVGMMNGYSAGVGYDMATGLGSVDANALVTNWAVAPNIVSLSPNPIAGSPASQNLTIDGAGFVGGSGRAVTVGNVTYRGAAITLVSSSQLVVSINVGIAAQSLPVSVTVLNGTTSNSVALTVTAPPEPPALSTLNPSRMAPSNSVQTLTVMGSGFVSGNALNVTVGGTAYSGAQVTYLSPTQLAVSVNVGTSCQLLPVQVTNPNGQASNSVSLPVSVTPAVAADVQAIVNQSLGISPPGDLNHDGTVNVVDVQIAVGDVLNFHCTQ